MSRRGKKRDTGPRLEDWVEDQQHAPRAAALEAEVERLSKLLGLVEAYHAAAAPPPEWMRPAKKDRPSAATACLHFSDLHLDEDVSPAETGGLNAYDREIAGARLRRWARVACELGERFRHEWDGACILWGGDSVSGSIHAELRESNCDVLPGTMVFWAPLIAAAFRQVAEFYGRVHVAAVVGNHGRMTKEKQFKKRARNSWDWLLVQMVRSHLAGDERFSWDVAQGSYLFVPVYGRNLFLTHGDEVGGGGGWAGVWSPLGTIHRRGVELAASHGLRITAAVVGHWHQLVLANSRGLVCNGSLKGADEFSLGLRLRPEPAMQGWWAETRRHGCTVAAPIFVEDRKAEGW